MSIYDEVVTEQIPSALSVIRSSVTKLHPLQFAQSALSHIVVLLRKYWAWALYMVLLRKVYRMLRGRKRHRGKGSKKQDGSISNSRSSGGSSMSTDNSSRSGDRAYFSATSGATPDTNQVIVGDGVIVVNRNDRYVEVYERKNISKVDSADDEVEMLLQEFASRRKRLIMQFDDRPVGAGSGAKGITGSSSSQEDFSSYGIDALFSHSSWKARKEALDKVQREPSKFKVRLLENLKSVSNESNAAAQESAFAAFAAVTPLCNSDERELLAGESLRLTIEKGITGRPKAVASSHQFVAALVEGGSIDAVFSEVLKAFSHRTPKNRAAAAQLVTSLVSSYGVQCFPVKDILKAMQPLFNDSNSQVRKEAVDLCCQCYKYIGASIRGFLSDLRDVQLQELQKQFETIEVGAEPPKVLKSASSSKLPGAKGAQTAKSIESLTDGTGKSAFDAAEFEMLDESPVVSKLPKQFFLTALDKEKIWQDRVEYVNETLMPLLTVPRFRAKDDYHELAGMMKEYLVDPQAPLMLLGFKMIQDCARGLRSSFAPYARLYVAPLLDKMKDKKVSVLLHVMETLESLICYQCLTMDQCNEELEQVSTSKNPSQRTAMMKFCIRMIDKLGDGSHFTKLGRSNAMLKRLVNDEKTEIRNVAYVLLHRLITVFGEASYGSVLASMDENQKQNMEVAVARGVPDVGPRQPAQQSYAAANLTPQNSGASPFSSPAKKQPRVDVAVASSPAPKLRKPLGGSLEGAVARQLVVGDDKGVGDSVASKALNYRESPSKPSSISQSIHLSSSRSTMEDSISLESSLPPKMESVTMVLGLSGGNSSVLDGIRSPDWVKRQEAVTELNTMVQQWSPAQAHKYLNFLVVVVRSHPSFREATYQVFHIIMQMFQEAVSKVANLSLGAGYALVSGLTPRLTEPKSKPLVRDLCSAVAGKLGTRFVIRHLTDSAAKVKTPRLLQEVCEYIRALLSRPSEDEETAADIVDVKTLLQFLKNPCIEMNNAAVRQEVVLLLVELHRNLAPGAVDRFVASLPLAVQTSFQKEVQKSTGCLTAMPSAPPPLPPTAAPSSCSTIAGVSSKSTSLPKRGRMLSCSPAKSRNGRDSAASSLRSSTGLATEGNFAATTRVGAVKESPRSSASADAVYAPLRAILNDITNGADWRDRLIAVRSAEEYVKGCERPLPMHAAGPLLKALHSRFGEANKNFVVDVLRFIPAVVEAAVPEECRASLRLLAPGVLAMLGDQKATLREEARTVALLTMKVVGLESLLPLLQKPLMSDSNACRQNTLELMELGFEQQPPSAALPRAGMQLLIGPVISSAMDRFQEVRVIAEQVLGRMLRVVGEEAVVQYVQQLKPADQQVVLPIVERQCAQVFQRNTGTITRMDISNFHDNEESHKTTPVPPTPLGSRPCTPRRGSGTPRRYSGTGTPREHRIVPPSQMSATNVPSVAMGTQEAVKEPAAMTTAVVQPSQKQRAIPDAAKGEKGLLKKSVNSAVAAASDGSGAAADGGNEEMYSVQEILIGLRSAAPNVAYTMCTDFTKHLRTGVDCGTPEMIQVMTERLYENTRQLEPELALALIGCLNTMFTTPRSAARCHSSLLFRMIGVFFNCLLSERFSLNEVVIKSLNSMTLKMLEGCATDDVFSAMLSRMTSYSTAYLQTGRKSDLKYIQVTVRCVMRLDLTAVSADNIILCCHEYLLQHPPSAFRDLDDLPIRTVKTILQSATKKHGVTLLGTADRLVGSQNLVTHFIRACLDLQEKSTKVKGSNELRAAEESRHQQRASQSPAPAKTSKRSATPMRRTSTSSRRSTTGSHQDPHASLPPATTATAGGGSSKASGRPRKSPGGTATRTSITSLPSSCTTTVNSVNPALSGRKNLADIFGRIRNHMTSSQGIDELYQYLRDSPPAGYEEGFKLQFNRCSEAFRQYIKRKVVQKMDTDSRRPATFQLPQALRELP